MWARMTPKPMSPRAGALYLRGPIPWWWLRRASQLSNRALTVGLVIWFWAGLQKTHTIRLTSQTLLPELAISRYALRRALHALEQARLVRVQRRPGHPPIVTLVQMAQRKK